MDLFTGKLQKGLQGLGLTCLAGSRIKRCTSQ